MKKLICLCMVLALIIAAFAVPVSAAGESKLTVTTGSGESASFDVDDEIVYFVGVYAGEKGILNGQAYVTYDHNYLEVIDHQVLPEGSTDENDKCAEAYSFSPAIFNSNNVLNLENEDVIRYNFTKATGIGVLNDATQLFVRFRFKVKAAGATEIKHEIDYMADVEETRVYDKGKANTSINPYDKETVEKAVSYTVGDIDGNGKVNNKEAMILDRKMAKWPNYDDLIPIMDAADLDRNGKVNNKDAMILDRKMAKWPGYDDYIISVEN